MLPLFENRALQLPKEYVEAESQSSIALGIGHGKSATSFSFVFTLPSLNYGFTNSFKSRSHYDLGAICPTLIVAMSSLRCHANVGLQLFD